LRTEAFPPSETAQEHSFSVSSKIICGGNRVSQGIASSADAEIILKLYELRTETVMRQARAWMLGEFWPSTAAEFFAVQDDFGSQNNCYLRQVVTYWEMAASLVLHGALSSDLFVDCNPEPFFILAKLAPLMPEIHAAMPKYFAKTLQLVENSQAAAARFAAMKENVEKRRQARSADWLRQPKTAQ
jgi:hypothetical protein